MTLESHNIAVVVPLLNEVENVPELQQHLGLFQFGQIIFVDGGSTDGTLQWLQQNITENPTTPITVVNAIAGRAKQLNAGAAVANKPYLLFLHADTRLPQNAVAEIVQGLQQSFWGRFDVRFAEPDRFMKVVAGLMNWRSRWSKIATGDQALFMQKTLFEKMGGFADIPLMEDIEICKRLMLQAKPYCSRAKVQTSARRWLQHGRVKTVLLMWLLRWRYFRGVAPAELAQQYQNVR